MSINNITNMSPHAVNPYEKMSVVGGADAGQAGAVSAVGRAAGVAASQTVTVDFSNQSQVFVQAKNALAQLPDVREDKVRALKARIESGTYSVDGAKLAGKMLTEALVDIFA